MLTSLLQGKEVDRYSASTYIPHYTVQRMVFRDRKRQPGESFQVFVTPYYIGFHLLACSALGMMSR